VLSCVYPVFVFPLSQRSSPSIVYIIVPIRYYNLYRCCQLLSLLSYS